MQFAPVSNLNTLHYDQKPADQNSSCMKSTPNCVYSASGELICNKPGKIQICPDETYNSDLKKKPLYNKETDTYFGNF